MKPIALGAALASACLLAACGKAEDPSSAKGPPATPGSTAATAPSGTGTPPGSGARSSSTTASTTAPTAPTAPAAPTSTAPGAPGGPATMGAAADGQKVYAATCVACHGAGIAGAPKIGDKADWEPRVAQGKDTLYQHALQGFQGKKGVMPPKGGNTALPDPEVKAAVDYMVSQAR
ncbi:MULTISPECIES: c-type cytochrome [Ramlibacter]|uniref:C-type cytochrome n=1 Tax=Ramlibacter pinisoli TaxID=2682844 RepID=A0A6N8IUN6_9BURK|nr:MULTISPECIES: c-type cytochrome [Ramlibacter]MBA2964751.1 cytochrome c5 family protein [Ramlibacter sp. CGMCC 1.13660]MVQ29716.1 c-type cytochrome [Ramlibacter pinisoli]